MWTMLSHPGCQSPADNPSLDSLWGSSPWMHSLLQPLLSLVPFPVQVGNPQTVMSKAIPVAGPGTHRADVFFKSTGATMEADPWTDRQETFRPLVSS